MEKKTEVTLNGKEIKEEIEVAAKDLWETVKKLAHEVNVRKIIIKNKEDVSVLEIPVTVAGIATIFLYWGVAIGAIAALAADYKIEVVKVVPEEEKPAETPPEAPKA